MKICVLGAGVVGVSTAFALGRAGHEVHVIESAKDAAQGASQSNGAQLAYSYVDPFAGPTTLRQLPAYLSGRDPAVRFGLSLRLNYISWGLKFLKECSHAQAQKNLKARVKLAQHSEKSLASFTADCSGDVLTPTSRGKIVLASSETQLAHIESKAENKRKLGVDSRVLSKLGCTEKEPALSLWTSDWAGGLYAAGDTALDTQTFCKALKTVSEQQYGVKFHFGQTAENIVLDSGKVTGIDTDHERHVCQRVIVCLGNQATQFLKPYDIRVPIYPMQGYSLTLPATSAAPHVSVTDLKHKVVFTNIGDHIRIAGFMDANQKPESAHVRNKQLHDLARRLWPSIADYDADPHYWTHYRPMTPSGVPIIMESKISGLYLNIGHGSLGYTFAAGSAMIVTDMISQGRSPEGCPSERKNYT